MFKKLYLKGASPPHWPGAGPGDKFDSKIYRALAHAYIDITVRMENQNGH